MNQLTDEHIDHVLDLVAQNRKLEAVKFVVEHSNLGLKEAKDFVELISEDPDVKPYSMNLAPFSNDNSSKKMSTIQVNYATDQVFVRYENGEKIEIDERHSAWNEAMQVFGRGVIYKTKSEYLEFMRRQRDELDSISNGSTPHQSPTNPAPSAYVPKSHALQNKNQRQSNGVEDLTARKSPTHLIILLIVVLLAVALVAYLL